MDKILFSYSFVCYIIFSSIVMLTQAGIDCSNLTSVCPNRPVVLTCKAPQLPIQWQSKNCTPKLFEDIVLRRNSVKEYKDGFVATVVDIKNDSVLTSLEFFPNCSYEHQCRIQCEYGNSNDNLSEDKDCIIHYEYIKSPLAPINFINDSNRYGIVTLSWKLDNNSIVEHAYLSVQLSSDDDKHRGETYIVDRRNNYTITGIQANTTYKFFLRVENCMGSNETNITVETESYSPTTPEFDVCTIHNNVSSNMSNITTLNAEVNWQCGFKEQIADYYKVRVIGENNELIHQEHFATSCGKSYFVLPYEGMFTVEVSALNEYGESQPKSKKLIYSSSFLTVAESFNTTDMTVQCCVQNLASNANCTIIIKEDKIINQTNQFEQEGCAFITIPKAPHHHDNLSYEAYIDGDPDICYRIIKNNGTSGAMEQKGSETDDEITIWIIVGSVLLVLFLYGDFMIIKFFLGKIWEKIQSTKKPFNDN